jgi:hypothetical protein
VSHIVFYQEEVGARFHAAIAIQLPDSGRADEPNGYHSLKRTWPSRRGSIVATYVPGRWAAKKNSPTVECHGHVSHFSEGTVGAMRKASTRRPQMLASSEKPEHLIEFEQGCLVGIRCPVQGRVFFSDPAM